ILGPSYPTQNQLRKEDFYCCDENNDIIIDLTFEENGNEQNLIWRKDLTKQQYKLKFEGRYPTGEQRETLCPLHIPPNRAIRDLPASSKWTPLGRILFELNKKIEENREVHQNYLEKMQECVKILGNSDEFSKFTEGLKNYTSEQLGTRGESIDIKLDIIDQRNILKTLQIFESIQGNPYNVSLGGQGVQSAITMAALRSFSDICGGRLFIIADEPEAYLHPLAQKSLCKVFEQISENDTQIILTTHSPYFISPKYIEGIVRVWMENGNTKKKRIDLEQLRDFKAGRGVPEINIGKVKSRLSRQLTLSVKEGLFGRFVVLCEGETELLSLDVWSENEGYEFSKKGIAFVEADGKFSMIDIAEFYKSFNIPVYLIWDSDRDSSENIDIHKKHNRLLLDFAGASIEDFPSTVISSNYTVFDPNFETVIRDGQYQTFEREVNNELGLIRSDSQKGIRARYVALKYQENNIPAPSEIKSLLEMINQLC
ncbi:MAG: ATP-dependent endonuclease, partial [Candidatus Hodarchaeota archaeon]